MSNLPPNGPQDGAPVLLEPGALTRCRHRVHLDAAYPDLLAAAPENTGVKQRQEAAAAQREAVRVRLMDADPDAWVRIDPDGPPGSAARATLEACRNGADKIWGAVLPSERTPAGGGGSRSCCATSSAAATCPSSSSTTRSPTRNRSGHDRVVRGAPTVDEKRKVRAHCATRCGWPR